MANLFAPTAPTKEQIAVQQIDTELRNAANAQKRAYDRIRSIVYHNNKLTPSEVFAAFQSNTTTGLSADQLGEMAKIIKALTNRYAPGTITDEVPAPNITL